MQNINLLCALPPRPKEYLSTNLMVKIIIGLMLALIITYTCTLIITSKQETKLKKLIAKKQDVTQKLTTINNKLAAAMAEIGNFKSAPQRMLLANTLLNKKHTAFSNYLVGLAKTIPQGVRLTSFTFSSPDNNIILNGETLSTVYLSDFINNLSKTSTFSGKQFHALQLTEKQNKKIMVFKLSAGKH